VVAALATVVVLGGAAGCAVPDEEPSGPASPSNGGGDATAWLDQLKVAKEGTMSGYSRKKFPHWRKTGKNCDVRDSVLERDGTDIKLSGCNVVGGRWTSVYDNSTFTDPSDVDIDHTVPLANAWRSGASGWDDTKRGDFANDLTRPQLLAVSASSNRAKGDQNPAQWKPANREHWCKYAEDWIAVKYHWKLYVTADEKATLSDMLGTCR